MLKSKRKLQKNYSEEQALRLYLPYGKTCDVNDS